MAALAHLFRDAWRRLHADRGLLQRFVLLLDRPVYSLTVTLFSVLLGRVSAVWSAGAYQRYRAAAHHPDRPAGRRRGGRSGDRRPPGFIRSTISASHAARIPLTVLLITPAGVLMGMPLPAGIRLMTANHSALLPLGVGDERRPFGHRGDAGGSSWL